jgi:lysyl-tRNA synthetase class 1
MSQNQQKSWPFQEAQALVERYKEQPPGKGYVLFETGYGPSGLPHIGTFGEVARTTMVRRAFAELSDLPTRLFAFSDDMDGLRKVPDNVPNQEELAKHLGKPLTSVPDPFGTHESFGHHNNARLRTFLDQFGFEYEFKSATECYRSGMFDAVLLEVLKHYDEVTEVILPTLGADRRATYSPFLPVSPKSGEVLQVPLVHRDPDAGTIVYQEPDGEKVELPVTGGRVKLQWKADWAMRWRALEVDYEMSGKDLIDSVRLSSRICSILGGRPPEGFNYELFLDENGEKISKSRGNGLALEDWLRYASPESLALYMFQSPRKAKRLYFDVIPKAVDEYASFLKRYHESDDRNARLDNPVWHIHGEHVPAEDLPLGFGILLNLVSACNTDDPAVLWGFVGRYIHDANPANHPLLDRLVHYAIAYYRDFVEPTKSFRGPTPSERAALEDLQRELEGLAATSDAEAIQNKIYEVGKRHNFPNLRDWFGTLYEVLFGQSEGPRMGSFVALYGLDNFLELMRSRLQPAG